MKLESFCTIVCGYCLGFLTFLPFLAHLPTSVDWHRLLWKPKRPWAKEDLLILSVKHLASTTLAPFIFLFFIWFMVLNKNLRSHFKTSIHTYSFLLFLKKDYIKIIEKLIKASSSFFQICSLSFLHAYLLWYELRKLFSLDFRIFIMDNKIVLSFNLALYIKYNKVGS